MTGNKVVLAALAALLTAASVQAGVEEEDGREAGPDRRWSLSVTQDLAAGATSTRDVVSSMRAAGLDQPLEDFFSGGSLYFPSVFSIDELLRSYTLGYRLRPKLDLRLAIHERERSLVEVTGYHGPFRGAPLRSELWLDPKQSIRTLGTAVAAFVPQPGLRVGVGLSVDRLRVETWGPNTRTTSTRPGLVLEGALQLPRRTRLYVELSVQRRFVLPLEFGPFDLSASDGSFHTTFPRTRAHFSQTLVSLGLGIRF